MKGDLQSYFLIEDCMRANAVAYEVCPDGELKRIFRSDTLLNFMGITAEAYEKANMGILDFAPESDYLYAKEMLNYVIKTGETVRYTHRLIHPQKGQVWIVVRAGFIELENEKPILLVNVLDMSETAFQYEHLIDMSNRMVYVLDENNNEILYANQVLCKHFQLENYVGKKCSDLFNDNYKTCPDFCYVRQAAETNTPIDYYSKNGKTCYRIMAKKGKWGNHSALLVYTEDVTKQKEQEQKAKKHYTNTYRTLMEMNRHAVSMYTINISKNIVLETVSKYRSIDIRPDQPLNEFADMIANRIPDSEKAQLFRKMLSRENLLEEYEKGNYKLELEHFYYLEDRKQDLLNTCVTMVRNPMNEDVEAIVYAHNWSNGYINRQIQRALLSENYEGTFLIDIEARTVFEYNGLSGKINMTARSIGEAMDYDEGLAIIAEKYVIPRDMDSFLIDMDLAQIIRTLRKGENYSIEARTYGDGGNTKLVRFVFAFLDERERTIICNFENITEEMEKDELTHALNRRGLMHRLDDYLNYYDEEELALLYWDIDHFKAINDRFGVDFGDEVLIEITKSLQNSKLEPLIVSRLEADHFVILVNRDKLDLDYLQGFALEPIGIRGLEINVVMSCGIYMIEKGTNQVKGLVDKALLAKERVENPFNKAFEIYSHSMRIDYLTKAELTNDAIAAFRNKEFEVYYQPIYDAKTERIASAEALIRWNHPSRGVISPALFLPNLIENGHITEVDFYVAHSVGKFVANRYRDDKPLVPIDINLTWLDFCNREGMERLLGHLRKGNVPKGTICIEITEASYASITEYDTKILDTFKEEGCRILVDDFGTGYSSFGVISGYDFDIIKLDMSFTQKIGVSKKTEAILESLIDMAHGIGARVVAEGVETKEQLDFLRDKNCDYIQGFYFSQPVTEVEFARLLGE